MNSLPRVPETSLSLVLFLGLAGCHTVDDNGPAIRGDFLIENGTVYDGTGGPSANVDIVVQGDKITFIGDVDKRRASRFAPSMRIDASNLVVAPGFIDPHTHAGSDLRSDDTKRRANFAYSQQGVTTVVIGNDGHGSGDIAKQSSLATERGIGTNVAYLAGFGQVRKTVLGDENRVPTTDEMEKMKSLVEKSMCAGAYGFSAGLYYAPQSFAKSAEVAKLMKISASFGGYYDTHMRDESTYNIGVKGALREALKIGEQSGAPVHISHIKALGPAVWGHSAQMIEMIEKARTNGQKVTADQYPWLASGTRISSALVPRWALDGGLNGLRERFRNPSTTMKIKSEMAENLKRRGGADKLLITGSIGSANATIGLTLADIAKVEGLDPLDAAMLILMYGDARVASFNMNENDIKAFAAQDWVVTGSDGSTGHPRKYGSFPKAYRDFVVDSNLLSMSQFVRRSSGRSADIIGLKGRGYLKTGFFADIVVFDPKRFAPLATYQQPTKPAVGVEHLMVNGKHVIAEGQTTGALSGQPLLKKSKQRNRCNAVE